MRRILPLRIFPALVVGSLCLLVGCGGENYSALSGPLHPVTGKVLLAPNQPLAEGEIIFMPETIPGRPATGQVGSDGTFTLKTPELGDGAMEGEYSVHVTTKLKKQQAGRSISVIPAVFGDPEITDLKATVKSGSNTLEPFLLIPKAPQADVGPTGERDRNDD